MMMSEQNEKQMNFTDESDTAMVSWMKPGNDDNERVHWENAFSVYFIVETSARIAGTGIAKLNEIMVKLIECLRDMQDEDEYLKFQVAVLEYNSGFRWITPDLVPVSEFTWKNLQASGGADLVRLWKNWSIG